MADANGAKIAINSYDEWGNPGAANAGRFGYTGQIWIAELGLWHYKARIYSPALGRFLQTDPIGYDDQMNLYAYVGNDPMNSVDPTGECTGSLIQNKEGTCRGAGNVNPGLNGAGTSDGAVPGQNKLAQDGLEAGREAIGESAEKAFNEDREPGGLIFAKDGEVGRTPTEWGEPCQGSNRCSVQVANQLRNVPEGARVIYIWHGHGGAPERRPWLNARFSEQDSRMLSWWQRHHGVFGSILGTPQGHIRLMITPFGWQEIIGRFDRPWWANRRKR